MRLTSCHMSSKRNIATARAHSNIAFIKYWGNSDNKLRLPANPSLSMNLATLHTTTTVEWSSELPNDSLTINGSRTSELALTRVKDHLDMLRKKLKVDNRARVESCNNFPMGTGIASSASAFAALTVAAVAASGVILDERELSALARLGSGSAARSIPSGFVEWRTGANHESSYAETFVERDHWGLVDVIAIVSRQHKRTGSSAGHQTAHTSVLQAARVESATSRLRKVKDAILARDFVQFAQVVEEDSNLMHAVMMTSSPPLFYWKPISLEIMESVRRWRKSEGLQVCYTLDAGPNVHCICAAHDSPAVAARLRALVPEIDILQSPVGGGATTLPAT